MEEGREQTELSSDFHTHLPHACLCFVQTELFFFFKPLAPGKLLNFPVPQFLWFAHFIGNVFSDKGSAIHKH